MSEGLKISRRDFLDEMAPATNTALTPLEDAEAHACVDGAIDAAWRGVSDQRAGSQ